MQAVLAPLSPHATCCCLVSFPMKVDYYSAPLHFPSRHRVASVFDLRRKLPRQIHRITYNTLLSAYVRNGQVAKAFNLFEIMKDRSVSPVSCMHLTTPAPSVWSFHE